MSGVLNLLLAGAASAIRDAYFNLTTLLLNTSSTNGAQNNTFLDSSTNNFTITRNGNTTQGTFTPFSQTGWSNYFTGSTNNSLTVPASSGVAFGTGDFSVEIFGYANSFPSVWRILAFPSGAVCNIEQNTGAGVGINFGSGNVNVNTTLPLNEWFHLAITRQSGTVRVFLNGQLTYTAANTTNYSTNQDIYVGGYVGFSQSWDGYLSNFRIQKGAVPTAYQTSSTTVSAQIFTPPTVKLSSDVNTSVLVCQSNRFKDESSNAFAVTVTGTPSVQAFSPFAPTAAYSTSVVGGSGYFDGSGDYITATNNAAYNFGTGNFTVECWVYVTAFAENATDVIVSNYQDSTNGWTLGIFGTGNKFYFAIAGDSGQLDATSALQKNTWVHLAAVRSSTTMSFFINGTREATATNSTNNTSTSVLTIGSSVGGGGLNFNGYLSGLRVVKGTAVYDPTQSTLTLPTTAPTAITNTSLLLNYTNAGIFDSAAKNVLETVGNAQVSTTQAKWGTTSMSFDGTGDTLNSPPSQVLSLGSGNWTIECWVRLNATGTETTIGQSKNYYTAGFNGNFIFRVGTTNLWRSFDGQASQTTIDGTFSWSTGVWYHVAWVRNSGTVTVYRDGTSLGSVSDSKTLSDSANGIILGNSLNAYIDDLRITVGLARYTTTFTPPTAALPTQQVTYVF